MGKFANKLFTIGAVAILTVIPVFAGNSTVSDIQYDGQIRFGLTSNVWTAKRGWWGDNYDYSSSTNSYKNHELSNSSIIKCSYKFSPTLGTISLHSVSLSSGSDSQTLTYENDNNSGCYIAGVMQPNYFLNIIAAWGDISNEGHAEIGGKNMNARAHFYAKL